MYLLQGQGYCFLLTSVNPCVANAGTIKVLAIPEPPVKTRLANIPSVGRSIMLFDFGLSGM